VRYEDGDLLADSYNILKRWKNYFSQLLNVHHASDIMEIEVLPAVLLLPGHSNVELQVAVTKLK
jgi:hypothetical protein